MTSVFDSLAWDADLNWWKGVFDLGALRPYGMRGAGRGMRDAGLSHLARR